MAAGNPVISTINDPSERCFPTHVTISLTIRTVEGGNEDGGGGRGEAKVRARVATMRS